MIPEVIDRGPIRWYTYHQGIRGEAYDRAMGLDWEDIER